MSRLPLLRLCGRRSVSGSRWAPRYCLDRCARPDLHQPIHNDSLTGFQARVNEPLIPVPERRLDRPDLDSFLGIHDVHEWSLRTLQHRTLRNQDGVWFGITLDHDFDKLTWQQGAFRVRKRPADDSGSGLGAQSWFHEVQHALLRIRSAIKQGQDTPKFVHTRMQDLVRLDVVAAFEKKGFRHTRDDIHRVNSM